MPKSTSGKSEQEPVKTKHRPAWQDEDADEQTDTISYRSSRRVRNVEDKSTPWRHDPPEEEEDAFETVRSYFDAEGNVISDPTEDQISAAVPAEDDQEPETAESEAQDSEPAEPEDQDKTITTYFVRINGEWIQLEEDTTIQFVFDAKEATAV